LTPDLAHLAEALTALLDDGQTDLLHDGTLGLEAERRRCRSCTRCPLAATRTTAVYGEGNPLASLLLVGEGPGADEDRLGRPFVGQAGRLLDELLAEAGLDRRAVYITNVVKCRPPHNRDPLPEEAAACRPFLDTQIARLRPRVLLCLGNVAARLLLGTTERITAIRGQVRRVGGQLVVPTVHPAYILRNMRERGLLVADLALAVRLAREL
jgi:DNA polymerase